MAEKKIHDSKTKTHLMKCAKKEFMEKYIESDLKYTRIK